MAKNAEFYMDGELTPELLEKFITSFLGEAGAARAMEAQDALYRGGHDILSKKAEENKPCNRLVADFPGQIIDTMVGYFLGKPISIQLEDDTANDEVDRILAENDADDLFMEVGKEASIKGRSGIMVYQDEAGETRLVRVPAESVMLIYDTSVGKKLRYAVRLYGSETADGKRQTHAEVYSDHDVTVYVSGEGVLSGGKPATGYVLDGSVGENPRSHIFRRVPYTPLFNNEEGMGDLEKVSSLIADYDKILSLEADEHEAFRNAYLLIKNMTVSNETIQRLKQEGVIEVGEDGDVKFVTKTLQHEAVQAHLDRIQTDIHKFAQVPDLTDEEFAGNLSGVAIRFKLFGLETKCIIKERKFTKCLLELLRIISIPAQVRSGAALKVQDVTITFSRNIPDNLLEIVDVVTKLKGTVDVETLLALLPFIDNPGEVLAKLEKEQDSLAEKFMPNNNQFAEDGGEVDANSTEAAQPV